MVPDVHTDKVSARGLFPERLLHALYDAVKRGKRIAYVASWFALEVTTYYLHAGVPLPTLDARTLFQWAIKQTTVGGLNKFALAVPSARFAQSVKPRYSNLNVPDGIVDCAQVVFVPDTALAGLALESHALLGDAVWHLPKQYVQNLGEAVAQLTSGRRRRNYRQARSFLATIL